MNDRRRPPPSDPATPLVPARMVNEWVYCPRLAYLEWVEGEWAESSDTAQGKRVHARVDQSGGRLPAPEELGVEVARVRSVTLSSERLEVIAKMDVVDVRDGLVMPVDFKKGKRPHVAFGAYDPERVQVCVQAMILEDNGYRVEQGAIWYAGSRERVRIALDDALRARSLEAIAGLRAAAEARRRPPAARGPRTVPSVRVVHWPASASPTRPTCSRPDTLRARSTRPMIPRCLSTYRRQGPGCARAVVG